MRLTLSEIGANALKFAAELADALAFQTGQFAVFGLRCKQVAGFEVKVTILKGALCPYPPLGTSDVDCHERGTDKAARLARRGRPSLHASCALGELPCRSTAQSMLGPSSRQPAWSTASNCW